MLRPPSTTSSTDRFRVGGYNPDSNGRRITEYEEDGHRSTSSASKSSSTCCSWLLAVRLLDTVLLLGLTIAQGSLLNYLIIFHRQRSHAVYLWFLADFVVVMAFVGALLTSYQRVVRHIRRAVKSVLPSGPELPFYGALPLGYLSWFVYSSTLVAKIVVIFRWGIAARLGDQGLFTAQLLKIILGGGASLVFLLLVNSHRPPSHPNDDARNYVASLCTGTAFEIFDAIAILEVLFVDESRVVLTYPLERVILALSSIGLILPTLSLVRFSLADFGQSERPPLFGLVYSTLKLLAIEVPYLGVRVYLWDAYTSSSVFMLKNILMIVVKLRYILPEYIVLLAKRRAQRQKDTERHLEMNTVP